MKISIKWNLHENKFQESLMNGFLNGIFPHKIFKNSGWILSNQNTPSCKSGLYTKSTLTKYHSNNSLFNFSKRLWTHPKLLYKNWKDAALR